MERYRKLPLLKTVKKTFAIKSEKKYSIKKLSFTKREFELSAENIRISDDQKNEITIGKTNDFSNREGPADISPVNIILNIIRRSPGKSEKRRR